jgi:replicative DNA helicase
MATLESVADRLCFLRPPFSLDNVAAAADTFGAQLIVLDYIQRISPPGMTADRRGSVDATMNYVRQFADTGVAMIVVAAVSRQKDQRGRSSYSGDALSLASFRESSELEFGADDAFILCPDTEVDGQVNLRHLKARHTEPEDVTLHFDRRIQRFMSAAPPPGKRKAQEALAAHWKEGHTASGRAKEGI